jgi:UDP-N-acetylmuramate--alanine ligase
MIGALSAVHTTIAIAGCHGKTTVGAYLGTVLEKAGHDPSVLLRSPVEVWHHNVRCGKGKHLIVEADENERRFLSLTPAIGVITNIEADHLDYFKDLDAIIRAYHQFARITCRTGVLIANHDDANVVAALKGVRGEIIWFGAGEGVQVRAMDIQTQGTVTSFLLHIKRGEHDLQFDLSVPGVYQINNALSVAAVCHYLMIPMAPVREALSAYHGGLRHMELRGEAAHLIVIDDAADHPSEIKAVLAALRRQYPARKIYAVYQPYLFNRSRMLAESLAQAFTDADELWVCPIMPGAEEAAIPFTHYDLVTRIAQFHTHVLPFISAEDVARACNASDTPAVMITLGADPVRGIGDEFLKQKNGSVPH